MIRPTFYNGWRHFYFLSLPILFFAVKGFSLLFGSEKKAFLCVGCLSVVLFAAVNIAWIKEAHPYQIIYQNPLVRKKASGKFDRDYWLISTPECLSFLNDFRPEGKIRVFDIDAFVDYAKLGMEKEVRERFVPIQWQSAEEPVPFIIYNYTNKQGNNTIFPGYSSIYSIKRDNMKIAEIYQYDQNYVETFSGSYDSVHDNEGYAQIVNFDEMTVRRIELYECSSYEVFQTLELFFADGTDWTAVPIMSDMPNGFRLEFPITTTKMGIHLPAEDEKWRCDKIIIRGE